MNYNCYSDGNATFGIRADDSPSELDLVFQKFNSKLEENFEKIDRQLDQITEMLQNMLRRNGVPLQKLGEETTHIEPIRGEIEEEALDVRVDTELDKKSCDCAIDLKDVIPQKLEEIDEEIDAVFEECDATPNIVQVKPIAVNWGENWIDSADDFTYVSDIVISCVASMDTTKKSMCYGEKKLALVQYQIFNQGDTCPIALPRVVGIFEKQLKEKMRMDPEVKVFLPSYEFIGDEYWPPPIISILRMPVKIYLMLNSKIFPDSGRVVDAYYKENYTRGGIAYENDEFSGEIGIRSSIENLIGVTCNGGAVLEINVGELYKWLIDFAMEYMFSYIPMVNIQKKLQDREVRTILLIKCMFLDDERCMMQMFPLAVHGVLISTFCLGAVTLSLAFVLSSILWLGFIFNDTITGISMTFAVNYVAFFTAQEGVNVYGILVVLNLGMFYSAVARTTFKGKSQQIMHNFWYMGAYIANTLIFILSGVVIAKGVFGSSCLFKAHDHELGYLFLLYVFIQVARMVVIEVLFPFLHYFGYGLVWREAITLDCYGSRGTAIGCNRTVWNELWTHATQAFGIQEMSAPAMDGNGAVTGHIILTTIGGKNGEPKQTVSYMQERVVCTGSFEIVFQAKCIETGETMAIKKVLQDRRYKNYELQLMCTMDHPNIVSLKHCLFSTTSQNELFLNWVMKHVPGSMHSILKHYSDVIQNMPLIYLKLYTYQIFRGLAYMHLVVGVCHTCFKSQNVVVDPFTHQVGSFELLIVLTKKMLTWSLGDKAHSRREYCHDHEFGYLYSWTYFNYYFY